MVAPAGPQPAASLPRPQEPAAAVRRPHPERRADPAASPGRRAAQPPLRLRRQVWNAARPERRCHLSSCSPSSPDRSSLFSPTANRHMLRALAQAGGGAFEFFELTSQHTWAGKVRGHPVKPSSSALTQQRGPCLRTHPSAGGVPGEADGGAGLQFGLGEVAAVQPHSAPSCPSPQTAAGPVQRLPHPGVRLRSTLLSGARVGLGVSTKENTHTHKRINTLSLTYLCNVRPDVRFDWTLTSRWMDANICVKTAVCENEGSYLMLCVCVFSTNLHHRIHTPCTHSDNVSTNATYWCGGTITIYSSTAKKKTSHVPPTGCAPLFEEPCRPNHHSPRGAPACSSII